MTIGKGKVTLMFVLSFLLVITGVIHLGGEKGSSLDWKQYDLIGMLQKINDHNSTLGKTNQEIVGKMKLIDQQVDTTSEVAEKLTAVKRGLLAQNRTLSQLTPVTADQVTLSSNLRNLSMNIKKSMLLVSKMSEKQNSEIQKMNGILAKAKVQMKQVAKDNDRINGQLQQAETKSRQIEGQIP